MLRDMTLVAGRGGTDVLPTRPHGLCSSGPGGSITAVEFEVNDPGVLVPQVGLVIALKQLAREHELSGCSDVTWLQVANDPEAMLSRWAVHWWNNG